MKVRWVLYIGLFLCFPLGLLSHCNIDEGIAGLFCLHLSASIVSARNDNLIHTADESQSSQV